MGALRGISGRILSGWDREVLKLNTLYNEKIMRAYPSANYAETQAEETNKK